MYNVTIIITKNNFVYLEIIRCEFNTNLSWRCLYCSSNKLRSTEELTVRFEIFRVMIRKKPSNPTSVPTFQEFLVLSSSG